MDLQQLPIPTPDETYEHFVVRAHRELIQRIPEPSERNELVWRQWATHRGATEPDQIAQRTFTAERYARNPNVCVFAEHSAIDGQGRPRTYGLPELVRAVRSNNERICDYDGFSPISDGHTSNPNDPFPIEPDILGYAGPYRLGMIGRKNPRWAVFADEWHMRQHADRLARKPRRSVELWTFAHDPRRLHFDPIAAIGSETPRLALPIKFRREERDGVTVERYTFSAPSFVSPGAGNTQVKRFQRQEETPRMALTNEDLSQIMSAIAETPQFKMLDQMMQSQNPGAGAGAGEPGGDELPPIDDGAGLGGDDDLADLNDLMVGEPEGESAAPPAKPAAQPDKKTMAGAYSRRAAGDIAVKYSRLQKAHNSLVQEHGRTLARTTALERKATDADRAATIHALARKYPDFVDVDQELASTLYSRSANMSDEAFQNHVATVEKYAMRAEQTARAAAPDIPYGRVERPVSDGQREQYAAKVAQEAVKIHTHAINNGKSGMTWEEAKAEAEKRLKPA